MGPPGWKHIDLVGDIGDGDRLEKMKLDDSLVPCDFNLFDRGWHLRARSQGVKTAESWSILGSHKHRTLSGIMGT